MKQDEYSKARPPLELQKFSSWTPMGSTKDRSLSPNQLNWKYLGRAIIKRGPTRRLTVKEDSKVVNRDWVNNIHVVSVLL